MGCVSVRPKQSQVKCSLEQQQTVSQLIIQCKFINYPTQIIYISPNSTISNLKSLLSEKISTPTSNIDLHFRQKLADQTKLSKLCINNKKDRITVMVLINDR